MDDMKLSAVIIDDEKSIVEGLLKMLDWYCPQVAVLDTADGIAAGIPLLDRLQPDLLFLDIHLKDGTGIDLLRQLSDRKCQVIFITAYDGYAIEAFKFSAVDYLLKPIDPDDLVAAVQRARQVINKEDVHIRLNTLMDNMRQLSEPVRKIVLKDTDSIHVVNVADILYCQADGCYTSFAFPDGRVILSSKNLKTFENMLQAAGFFRCHHSFLVNLKHIQRFDKADGGQLVLSGDRLVPVSKRKREKLIEEIQRSVNFLHG